MAIFKLKPALKDYLWGGTRLKEEYGKETDMDIVAESWELSTHPDGLSVIDSGPYKGVTLRDFIKINGTNCLGVEGKAFEDFPVLIKFIDAKQPLSIQVHPDDEYAMIHENEYGKTEMWFILDAQPDSYLYFGTNRSLTKDEFREHIENGTVLDVLKKVPVKKGEVFFIPAGTIHAIGPGIQICEIQQNSNSTYRIYDYGRLGKDGKPRELHVDKAIDVANLEPIDSDFQPCGPTVQYGDLSIMRMAYSKYFSTYVCVLMGSTDFSIGFDSFGCLVVVDGHAELECQGQEIKAEKGDTVFITANSRSIRIKGSARFIYTRV